MTEKKAAPAREPAITRFLHVVEWLGNALPHPVTLFALLAAGVVVLAGSDFATPHGRIGAEAVGLVQHGFSTADALAAVTTAAFDYVGERCGFAPGRPADVVSFEHDPHEKIETLLDPVFVMRRGRVLLDRRAG